MRLIPVYRNRFVPQTGELAMLLLAVSPMNNPVKLDDDSLDVTEAISFYSETLVQFFEKYAHMQSVALLTDHISNCRNLSYW